MEPARHDAIPTGAYPVARWCRETPQAIAVIENEVSYSYSMLAANIVQTAAVLTEAGLRRSMIVAIDCNVHYLHLVLILACEILGAVHCSPLQVDLAQDGDLLAHCDFLIAMTFDDRTSERPRPLHLSPAFVEKMSSVAVRADDLALLEQVFPSADIVRIGRTSGTTGRPKFMGYTRKALNNIVDIHPYILKFDDTRQNFVSVHPFIQMGTYSDSLLALRSGSTVIYCSGGELAANARKLPACHTLLIVGGAAELSRSEQIRQGRLDQLSIRVFGGFIPPALRATLRETVTTEVRGVYSSNETSYITTNDDDGPGRLLPDIFVRIVDDDGRDRNPGEPGIIVACTPRMAASYLWDEAETARCFVDGWYWTNDIGYMPEPGKLVVLGRADEMLNLGGIKIAPHPIEERIKTIDGVTDAVLLGVDDAYGTSWLHVVIERDDPALDSQVRARIVPLLVGYVASFKLHCVDRLPRGHMGKVQRNLLKQSLEHRSGA